EFGVALWIRHVVARKIVVVDQQLELADAGGIRPTHEPLLPKPGLRQVTPDRLNRRVEPPFEPDRVRSDLLEGHANLCRSFSHCPSPFPCRVRSAPRAGRGGRSRIS